MSDMMLKVDNINVYYGQIHTLKDVSIEVKKGERPLHCARFRVC